MKKNSFSGSLPVRLEDGPERQKILRWLCVEHTGKIQLPLNQSATKEHREATYDFIRGGMIRVTVEVDKNGQMQLLKAKML